MNMKMRVGFAALVAALTGSGVSADTTDTTMDVTATVTTSCSVSASTLAFGNYDPLSAVPTLGTSTINVTCTLAAPFDVGLSAGLHGASVTTRQMDKGTGAKLSYGLFQDVTQLINWGNTVGTDTATGVGLGITAVPFTVFGAITAQQAVEPGAYSDTVTVTVTF